MRRNNNLHQLRAVLTYEGYGYRTTIQERWGWGDWDSLIYERREGFPYSVSPSVLPYEEAIAWAASTIKNMREWTPSKKLLFTEKELNAS